MVPSSAKALFQPPNQVHVFHRGKPLVGARTIREERLESGNVVCITLMALEQRTPEEVEERRQIDSDISRLAGQSQIITISCVGFSTIPLPCKDIFFNLGTIYSARFERLGDLAELEKVIMAR